MHVSSFMFILNVGCFSIIYSRSWWFRVHVQSGFPAEVEGKDYISFVIRSIKAFFPYCMQGQINEKTRVILSYDGKILKSLFQNLKYTCTAKVPSNDMVLGQIALAFN